MTPAPSIDSLIYDLRRVDFVYGGTHRALQSVDLRLKAGERVAILGSNGCGKSTLLQIMGGLLFPTAGEAYAFGQKLTEEMFQKASFTAFFRQRVGFLFQNPDVLLLDEPTAGLDPRTQVWLVEVLEELHSMGKTIITATHDLSILEEIADRAYVMAEDHAIVADGSAGEILDDLDLLLRVNLIHEHAHEHEGFAHRPGHFHAFTHRHDHPDRP